MERGRCGRPASAGLRQRRCSRVLQDNRQPQPGVADAPPMQDHTASASGSGDLDPPPPDRADAGGEGGSSVTARLPSRNASSKYDFVKVKVWLGENADYYYVLSRFLLSRMLTVTKERVHYCMFEPFPCRQSPTLQQ